MDKCKIILVRHAETEGNIEKRLTGRKDYTLTENGKKSIKLLTNELKNIKFDKIYSSTSLRAKKTVQQLAKINKRHIIGVPDLREMYFGIYDGWQWKDVNKIDPEIKQNQRKSDIIYGIPEQETMEEVSNRMYNCIYNIATKNIGKTVLISSHGVAIEAFLKDILKCDKNGVQAQCTQQNTCINEVDFINGKFVPVKIACTEHLNKDKVNI